MLWLVHEQCHETSQKTQTQLQRAKLSSQTHAQIPIARKDTQHVFDLSPKLDPPKILD